MQSYSNYSNKDDVTVASTTQPDSLWGMGNYSHLQVPQSTYPDPGFYVPSFNAADDAAFSLVPNAEGAFTNLSTDITSQNLLDPWSTPGPSTFDATSAVSQPQLFDASHWTGVAPFATYSVAYTPESGVSPTSITPTSQDELAWLPALLQTPFTTPASSPGHGGKAGWVAPEQGANVAAAEVTSPAGWASGISWPVPVAPGGVMSDVAETLTPAAALGKRRREADQPLGDGGLATHTDEVPPSKRARGGGSARGILKAARTRHKPAARIPKQELICKPKEAGCGAERLATPSSQGIYHQSLPGPSSQQGWAVSAADGTPTWVEGSVDEKEVNHIDNVQQQQEEATNLLVIPRIFKPEYWLLLQTSEADLVRGAVQAIRCRLCPGRVIKNFDDFKRHCETSERHPRNIHFCDRCGDFFARSDSLKRHRKKPPPECLRVTQVEALEKREVTVQVHEDFIRRMDHGLETGEGIERGFSEIIKERYPKSSKKRTGGRK